MSNQAPRQRTRVEVEGEGDRPEQSRTDGGTTDDEFWFDDGNIILEANGTQFKVYEGPLVEHSPFFRDMLSLPQPQSGEATSSDAPHLVALADSPEDLRHLLRALMPCKRIRPFIPPKRSFHEVSACIRLGHKYQIDELVDEGLKYLRTLYPSDFPTLQRRRPEDIPNTACAISVVNLARLTGADYLLPVALAQCCELGAEIIEGFQREDGSREYLGTTDLGRCFQAKEKLIEVRVRSVLDMFDGEPADDCMAREEDTESMRALQIELPINPWMRLYSCNVFWECWPMIRIYAPSLCHECDVKIEEVERAKQRIIFRQLPSLLGLEVDG